MSAATTVNLIVNQKASFQVGMYIRQSNGAVLDLSGHTVTAKYKETLQTNDAQASSFVATVADAANGEISISLTPEQTSNLQIGKYVYDVAITDVATMFKTRVIEGRITVSGGVS